MMAAAAVAAPRYSPASLSNTYTSNRSETLGAFGDDVGGDAAGAVALMGLRRGAHDGQFRQRLRASSRRTGWPTAARSPALGAVTRPAPVSSRTIIARLDPGDLEELGDDALVHIGVLTQIERREMKAEGVDRADEARQRAHAAHCAAVELALRLERLLEDAQVRAKGCAHRGTDRRTPRPGAEACAS